MIIKNHSDVTRDALAVMGRTVDPRLRTIMISLVEHLHSFVRDVHLTEREFREAVGLLNEMGKLSGDAHNETMLMAGSLGVSSSCAFSITGTTAIPRRHTHCLARSGA